MQWLRHRRAAAWVAAGCFLAAIGCGGRSADPAVERPPVLLITVDGLVAADAAPLGGAQEMPNLQRLVDQSAVWTTAQSATPMTRPAVATYLTGVAPDLHGVRDDLFAVLPEEIPTLAQVLSAEGYRAAGFPDSSFLPERSGLWRGFEAVDAPPDVLNSPARWLPRVRPPHLTTEAFSIWMDSLEEGSDWFGWVHLSFPLVGQIKQQYYSPAAQGQDPSMLRPPAEKEDAEDDDENVVQADDVPSYEDALSTFDEQLGRMLDLVEARADGSDTWILLAGTMGDQRRDESNVLPGLGYSLDRRVVDVPVIVRSPADGASLRSSDEAVWAPDVAATIASVAGVELPARAEGVSLTEPAPDRISFSWSWALLDQMGWRALASARAGDRELIVGEPLAPVAEGVAVDDLREALAARANPARAGLPGEITAPLLAHFEIEPEPIPEEGRDYDDETLRKRVAGRSWVARARYLQANWMSGGQTFTTIRARWDAQNYIAHLDRGHMMALRGLPQKELITKGAVQLRPDDPEAWHWFAHAHWGETGEDAERIISKIQPYLANQADALYDLACTRSLAGDLEVSAEFLERAYRAGFRDRPHILADPDLRNLRQSEFFSEVMQRLH